MHTGGATCEAAGYCYSWLHCMCFLFFSHPLFCPGEDFSAEAVPEIGGFILRSSRRADKQEGGVRNEKCKKKKTTTTS